MATTTNHAPKAIVALDAGPRRARRRRRLRPIGIALLVLLIAEAAARLLAAHLPAPQRWSPPEAQVKYDQMVALSRAHQTGGIVLLGTSLMDVGIDPAALGEQIKHRVPVYDASLAGGSLETVRWWYSHVVVPLLHPRIVVYGFTSRELNPNDSDGVRLTSQFFASPEVHRLSDTESVMQRLEREGEQVSYLFRYRTVVRHPSEVMQHRTPVEYQRTTITALGQADSFMKSNYATSALIPVFFRQTVTYRFTVSQGRVGIAEGTIADMQRSGATVLFVDMPVTSDYIGLHPRQWADWALYEHAVSALVDKTRVPALAAQLWGRRFFADPIHLNGLGTQRLTGLVAGRVVGLLPTSP